MPLSHLALDARMIQHSGIGTALRGLLSAWRTTPPPFDVTLMGDPTLLATHVPSGIEAQIVPFAAPIYGPGAIASSIPARNADVIMTMHYSAICRPWNIPQVSVVHDLIHITHPTRRGTALYMKATLALLRRRARFILTGSRHTKVQLQTLHGFDAHRVLTIPWGPGLAGVPHDAPQLNKWNEQPFLLAVGLYKPHKNWGFLIDRLAGLWKNGQLKLPLVAAGLDEQDRNALNSRIERLGVIDRVTILPRQTDGQMAALYAKAHVLLFPSLIEGFGLPIVEAMTSGTPVVAANLPPMNEVGGKALALFDPDVPETFDHAVLRVVNDEQVRTNLIALGHEQAAQYDWKKYAKSLERALARAAE